MWIFYITIIIFLILLLFAKLILFFAFGKRSEFNPNLKYFTVDDFENLKSTPIEFNSGKNLLKGYLYINNNIQDFKGLVVFVHGMGARTFKLYN